VVAKPRKPRSNRTSTAKTVSEPNEVAVEAVEAIETAVEAEIPETAEARPEIDADMASDDIVAATDPTSDLDTVSADATETLAQADPDTPKEDTDITNPDEAIETLTEEPETHLDDAIKEAEPETEAEPRRDREDTRAAYSPTPQPEPRSSGFWPLVFGGVVAALLGFILGRADQFDRFLPASMQREAADLTAIEAQTTTLGTQAEALSARTDALTAQSDDLAAQIENLSAAVAALQSAEPVASDIDTSALDAAIADLTAKIANLESRPVVAPGSPELEALVGSLEATISGQSTQISEQANQIAALTEGVASVQQAEQSTAAELLARAAMTRVKAALDAGGTYAPALADLEETGLIEVPEELVVTADEGVPTMAALSDAFPEAARLALAATRSADASTGGVDLGAFLTRQLGVRSVTPREGDHPDAILSRAEAALRSGDLSTALTELDALPDVAKSELSGWLEQAQTRQTALDAANAMSQSLPAN
jgi:hypothetical protein